MAENTLQQAIRRLEIYIKEKKLKRQIPNCVFDGNKILFIEDTKMKMKQLKKISKHYPTLVLKDNEDLKFIYPNKCYLRLYNCFDLLYPEFEPSGEFYSLKEILDDIVPKLEASGFNTKAGIPETTFEGNMIHFDCTSSLDSLWTFEDLLDILYSGNEYFVNGTLTYPFFHKYKEYNHSDLMHLLMHYPSYWNAKDDLFTDTPERVSLQKSPFKEERFRDLKHLVDTWETAKPDYFSSFNKILKDQNLTLEKVSEWTTKPKLIKKDIIKPALAKKKPTFGMTVKNSEQRLVGNLPMVDYEERSGTSSGTSITEKTVPVPAPLVEKALGEKSKPRIVTTPLDEFNFHETLFRLFASKPGDVQETKKEIIENLSNPSKFHFQPFNDKIIKKGTQKEREKEEGSSEGFLSSFWTKPEGYYLPKAALPKNKKKVPEEPKIEAPKKVEASAEVTKENFMKKREMPDLIDLTSEVEKADPVFCPIILDPFLLLEAGVIKAETTSFEVIKDLTSYDTLLPSEGFAKEAKPLHLDELFSLELYNSDLSLSQKEKEKEKDKDSDQDEGYYSSLDSLGILTDSDEKELLETFSDDDLFNHPHTGKVSLKSKAYAITSYIPKKDFLLAITNKEKELMTTSTEGHDTLLDHENIEEEKLDKKVYEPKGTRSFNRK